MDQGLIPRRYAKALYEVGEERNDNETLYGLMQRLADTFSVAPDLAPAIANPFVAAADKTSLLLHAVYGDDTEKAEATYADFIKLLEQNGRVDMARDIALAFISLYRKEHSIYRVDIASAAPMPEQQRKRLENVIAQHVGKGTMEYNYTTDPSLIGGFTVTVDSQRLDASVSNELQRLRRSLIK